MWLTKLERDLLRYYYKKDCSTYRWTLTMSEPIRVGLDEVIKELGYLRIIALLDTISKLFNHYDGKFRVTG